MKYNEFTAKKLGEVLAFARVGVETMEKGRGGLNQVWEDNLNDFITQQKEQATQIEAVAQTAGVSDVTMAKAEGTSGKLRSMRDMYVGDEWDNAAELLEWLGFFEGAAVVHWKLVLGAAETVQDEVLTTLAQDGHGLHTGLLARVQESISVVGSERAKE